MEPAKLILSKSGQRMAEIYNNYCLEYQRISIGFSLTNKVKRRGYRNYHISYTGEELTFRRRIDYNKVTLKWLKARGFSSDELAWYSSQDRLNCTEKLIRDLKRINPKWCINLMVNLMDVDKKREYIVKAIQGSMGSITKCMSEAGITLPEEILEAYKTKASARDLLELHAKAEKCLEIVHDHNTPMSAYFPIAYRAYSCLALFEAESRKYYTSTEVLDRQRVVSRLLDDAAKESIRCSGMGDTDSIIDIGLEILGYHRLMSTSYTLTPQWGLMPAKAQRELLLDLLSKS